MLNPRQPKFKHDIIEEKKQQTKERQKQKYLEQRQDPKFVERVRKDNRKRNKRRYWIDPLYRYFCKENAKIQYEKRKEALLSYKTFGRFISYVPAL